MNSNAEKGNAVGRPREDAEPASAFGAHHEHDDDIPVYEPQREDGMDDADLGLHKLSDYERMVQEQELRNRQAVNDAVGDVDEKQFPAMDDQLSQDDKDEVYEEELPPLRGNCWSRFTGRIALIIGTVIPAGGILASAMNIAGSTIGGGILGLPAGANQTGIILAIIYVILMVIFNVMSMRMLAITAEKTKIRSFEAMARYLFPQGHYAFSYWTAFIRWFNSMGSCIAYVISVGNSFKPIFTDANELHPGNPGYEYFMTPNGLKVMTVIVFFCIMVPLIIPRHVDSLRHAAFVAIILMLYFCVIVVVHSCTHGLKKHRHNVTLSGHMGRGDEEGKVFLFRTGNPVVEALGTFVFAFVCQVNAVEVYWDMAKHVRNPNSYTAAAGLAIGICAVIYTFVFMFGYFDFGAKALGTNSILLMYSPLKEPEVMLAYVGVLIKLCVAFALQFMAARNAFYYAIGFTERYHSKKGKGLSFGKKGKKKKVVSNEPKGDEEVGAKAAVTKVWVGQEVKRPAQGADADEAEAGLSMDQSYIDNIPIQWHLLVVGVLAAICLLLGLFIPNINVVFNFAGSICGSFLEFIIPALFVMYSGGFTMKKVGCFLWVMAHLSLIIGVIALVFGTGATVYGLAGGK